MLVSFLGHGSKSSRIRLQQLMERDRILTTSTVFQCHQRSRIKRTPLNPKLCIEEIYLKALTTTLCPEKSARTLLQLLSITTLNRNRL